MLPEPSNTEQWERLVRQGAGTWQQEWCRQALCLARKAATLTVAMSPMGYWTIGLLDKKGNWLVSPEVDVVVAALGVAEAIAWLSRGAMRQLKNGDATGPGVDANSLRIYQTEIEGQDGI